MTILLLNSTSILSTTLKENAIIDKVQKGRISMIKKIIGGILLFFCGITLVFGGMAEMPIEQFIPFIPAFIISIVLLASSDKASSKNAGKNQRLDEQVKAYFANNDTLEISDSITLRKPLNEGLTFNNLVVLYNDEVIGKMIEFNQYFPEAYKTLSNRTKTATFIKPEPKKAEPEPMPQSTLQSEASASKAYIDQINEYNTTIPDEKLSEALYSTTAMLKHLDILQTKYPKSNHKLDKLYQHYLPILLEILKNYVAVVNAHADKDEVAAVKQKLMKTIILINEAIKNITSSLFDEEMMNLSADMTVLENILKQDGLVRDEMDINSLNQILQQQEEAYAKEEK